MFYFKRVKKKLMKKIIIVLSLVLLFTACGKNNNTIPSTGDANTEKNETFTATETTAADTPSINDSLWFECSMSCDNSFLTKDYALYHDRHGRLQIFDVATKKDLVYCFDPGCEHKETKRSMTGEVLEQGCIAYEISRFPVMIKEDHLYFLNDSNEICVSDRQGENRKVIAKIPGYIFEPYNVYFSENAIFVDYSTQYEMIEVKDNNGESRWGIGETKQKKTGGVVSVDFTTGKVTEIFRREDYSAYVAKGVVCGEHVYIYYSYNDLPYVSPMGDANGFPLDEILNGMTVEEYVAEYPKHTWTDIYDYNTSTGEIKFFMEHQKDISLFFSDDFYAYNKAGENGAFYRYNGEKMLQLDFSIKGAFRTDKGFVFTNVTEREEYWLINDDTGEVVKKVKMPFAKFLPSCFIGDCVYGLINGSAYGYLSAEDFWNRRPENAIKFSEMDETGS